MVERYLSIAIAFMVLRQVQILIGWGMDFFRPLGDIVVAINVIDPISLAIITPLVVIGGKRILLGGAIVSVVWFVIGLFGSLQFLTGALEPISGFVAPLIAAVISLLTAILLIIVYRSRK